MQRLEDILNENNKPEKNISVKGDAIYILLYSNIIFLEKNKTIGLKM